MRKVSLLLVLVFLLFVLISHSSYIRPPNAPTSICFNPVNRCTEVVVYDINTAKKLVMIYTEN